MPFLVVFLHVYKHQSLWARTAAVVLITPLTPVQSATVTFLPLVHLIYSKKSVKILLNVTAGQLNVSGQVAQCVRTGACTWVYVSICMSDLGPFHRTAPPALQTLYPPPVWGRLQISDADDGRLLSSSGLRSVARARVGRPG